MQFLADENFNADILRGVYRLLPNADIVTVQQLGLSGAPDTEILSIAAEMGRIVLTHDVQTMPAFAYDRTVAGEPMAGVVAVPASLALRTTIDELLLIISCGIPGDFDSCVIYIPL